MGRRYGIKKINGVEPFCISIVTKIFIINSFIYKIITRKRLYNKIKDKNKIEELFGAQIFPLTVYILFKNIINIRFNLPSDLVPLIGLYRLIPIGKTFLSEKNSIF